MAAETPFDAKTFDQLQEDLLAQLARIDSRVDQSEGSVARTLLEVFAHELAVSYEQLRHVYRSGFLDTAEGSALDQVVALLGVERRQGGHLEGQVVFSRQQPAEQQIVIPTGTRLTGPPSPTGRPCPVVETVGPDQVMAVGATSVLMPVRSLEPVAGEGEAVSPLDAGCLSLMVQPILGVEQVSNPVALRVLRQVETDEELRQRARSWMDRVNLGTVGAMEAAVREQGVSSVKVLEPPEWPGRVQVVVEGLEASSSLERRVRDAVERTRPAGIRVEILGTTRIPIRVTATLVLRDNLDPDHQASLESRLHQDICEYITGLATGETVRTSRIRSLLTAPAEVSHLVEPEQTTTGSAISSLLWPVPADQADPVLIRLRYLLANGDVRLKATERAVPDDSLLLTLWPPVVEVLLDLTLADSSPVNLVSDSLRNNLQSKLDLVFPRQSSSWDLSVEALLKALEEAGNLPSEDQEGGKTKISRSDIQILYLVRPPLQLAQALVANGMELNLAANEESAQLRSTLRMNANDHLRIGQIRKASASPG
jgi:uncharacterized phage protein gp47/JayE